MKHPYIPKGCDQQGRYPEAAEARWYCLDRELLKAAAKAAGIDVNFDDTQWSRFWVNGGGGFWNPLLDDGDALRLAVKLQLRVIPPEDEFGLERASVRIAGVRELIDAFDVDPLAATRRAIVLAAAEIGRSMK